MWVIYAFLAAVFASLVSIFGKVGLKEVDPTLATTIRAAIMAAFLVVVAFTLGKFDGAWLRSFDTKALTMIALSGIAGALSWLFFFTALKDAPAVAVNSIDRLSIVFVLVFAALFLGETLTAMRVLAVSLIALGAVLIALYP